MKITKNELFKILKNNSIILQLYSYFSKDEISFDAVKTEKNVFDVSLNIYTSNMSSYLLLRVDVSEYDKKYRNINKYEIEDMGVTIYVKPLVNMDTIHELSTEYMWMSLFFNKTGENI